MKKKIAVACAAMMLTAGFASVAPDNFVDTFSTKVEAAQNTDPRFAFDGISFGCTYEDVVAVFGQPVGSVDDDEFIFGNGLIIEFADNRTVEEIETLKQGMGTDAGVAVGMPEYTITDSYGTADNVHQEHGKTIYQYFGGNGRFVLRITVTGGFVEKIKAKCHD